jgi:hypothetical protein
LFCFIHTFDFTLCKYFCKYPRMQQYVIFNVLKEYCIPKEEDQLVPVLTKQYQTSLNNGVVPQQSRKLGIWIHRTFGPVNCEELQDRTRFYRTDNKIMIFFLNNKFILFKCHILIALNLQLDSGVKVSVRVLMGSCSGRVRPKTTQLVFFASLLSTQH